MDHKEKAVIGLSLFAAVVIITLSGCAKYLDWTIHSISFEVQNGTLDSIFFFLTSIFDTKMFIGLCAITLAVLWVYHKRKEAYLGAAVLAGGSIVGWLLKQVFMQDRPIGFVIYETGNSFPSGHAVKVTLLAVFLLYIFREEVKDKTQQWILTGICILLIAIICISRLYLGVHWFTDIAGGITFAYTWTNWMFILFKKN